MKTIFLLLVFAATLFSQIVQNFDASYFQSSYINNNEPSIAINPTDLPPKKRSNC